MTGTPLRSIMPRPRMPPTPAASTDISGKSSTTTNAIAFDTSFALPPAALSSSSSAADNASDSSYHPISPTSPNTSSKRGAPAGRKRTNSEVHKPTMDVDYTLPPPPTRSRKIIQMKPKTHHQEETGKGAHVAAAAAAAGSTKSGDGTNAATSAGTKRKQTASNSASRKAARKTAHSLIERRRRSKMNEEFDILKNMIPACTGQQMHKLAILQASIDYMRYLQKCVTDLKEAHRTRRENDIPVAHEPPAYKLPDPDPDDEDEDSDSDPGSPMAEAVTPTHVTSHKPPSDAPGSFHFPSISPAIFPMEQAIYSSTTSPNILPSDMRHPYSATTSPNILPSDARRFSATVSPAIHSTDPRHYSISSSRATPSSATTSPVFVGQTPQQNSRPPISRHHSMAGLHSGGTAPISSASSTTFKLTSPALEPQPDADREDHDASEALLMLTADRRSWTGGDGGGSGGGGGSAANAKGGRGMSVKDLLSG